jgi:benzodiazapine receptor
MLSDPPFEGAEPQAASSRPIHGGQWHWGALVIALGCTALVGAAGALASIDAAGFYRLLHRPPWAPPAAVFGPVWTVLYVSMAVAAWMVVRARGWRASRTALILFGVQLLSNALWSWLFFRWHLGAAAFVDVVVLLVLIVATGVAFARLRPLAGLLLLPYLLWVGFATALTFTVWQLNPGLL